MEDKTAGRRAVAIRLAGQEYRIVSEADEASLQQLASYVDTAMERIRERTASVDSLEVALLTSLNMARELLALRGRISAGVVDLDAEEGSLEVEREEREDRLDRLIGQVEAASRFDLEALPEQLEMRWPIEDGNGSRSATDH